MPVIDVVGNEHAGFHEARGLKTDLALFANLAPQQVAAGELRQTQAVAQALGLRAFAAAGGPRKTSRLSAISTFL